MKKTPLISTGIFLSALLLAAPTVFAQTTYTWIGNAFNGDFASEENWLGNNVPPQLASGSLNLVFGESQSSITGLTNHRTPMRVNTLVFGKDADAYTIVDGSWLFQNQLYNLSQHEQVIQASTITALANNSFINTGKAGIRMEANITVQGGSQHGRTIQKRGLGTLTFAGNTSGYYIWRIDKGALVLDVQGGYQHSAAPDSLITLDGGELRVIGDNTGSTSMHLGQFGDIYVAAVRSAASNRMTVDGNDGEGTLITFSQWIGHNSYPGRTWDVAGTIGTTTTLNFHLIQNAGIHFESLQSGLLGIDSVIYWATTTTTDSNGNSLTGFAQLTGNENDGYDVARYDDYTALPSNQSGITGGHYYIDGSHTIEGSSVTGVNAARTLTLQGTGIFAITEGSFHTGNLLLQEGNGDYTIDIAPSLVLSSLSIGTTAQQLHRNNTLTIHQYRQTGDLVIQGGGLSGKILVTTGPGTIRLRTATLVNFTRLYIQEGRLQLEGNGANIFTEVHARGTVAGSSQIGSSTAFVQIYEGGTVDATPTTHVSEAGLRGLQIYGRLQLQDVSTFAMELTSDVLAGNYAPLRVVKEAESLDPTVTLAAATDTNYGVDLQLILNGPLSSTSWITLLETDGTISGTFATVNGQAFGAGNHFILSYLDQDYDAYLHYNYDLGGGMSGIVLQAVPEPATVALLAGLALAGVVWARRARRAAM